MKGIKVMKKSVAEVVAEMIAKMLDNGVSPWHQPWTNGIHALSMAIIIVGGTLSCSVSITTMTHAI